MRTTTYWTTLVLLCCSLGFFAAASASAATSQNDAADQKQNKKKPSTPKERKKDLYERLVQKQFGKYANLGHVGAAALMAYIDIETEQTFDAEHKRGNNVGLFQMQPTMWKDYQKYVQRREEGGSGTTASNKQGNDDDAQSQIDFVVDQVLQKRPENLKNMKRVMASVDVTKIARAFAEIMRAGSDDSRTTTANYQHQLNARALEYDKEFRYMPWDLRDLREFGGGGERDL